MAVYNDRMKLLILRWAANALGLMLTASIVKGISVANFSAAVVAALVLGLVNAILRPIILFLTLPLNILTLGLLTLAINGLMLWITAQVVRGFEVHGFLAAVLGALLLSLFSIVINALLEAVAGR